MTLTRPYCRSLWEMVKRETVAIIPHDCGSHNLSEEHLQVCGERFDLPSCQLVDMSFQTLVHGKNPSAISTRLHSLLHLLSLILGVPCRTLNEKVRSWKGVERSESSVLAIHENLKGSWAVFGHQDVYDSLPSVPNLSLCNLQYLATSLNQGQALGGSYLPTPSGEMRGDECVVWHRDMRKLSGIGATVTFCDCNSLLERWL